MSDSVWLVVGLGNPGPEYVKTRHNIGAIALEVWAARLGLKFTRHKKAQAFVAEGRFADDRVILVFPQTYMNQSGAAVKALMNFYKIETDKLIVLHDELDIDFATTRIKLGGGDNGHNGLRSIRSATDTGDWLRVRLGIGRPPGQMDPAAYVLKPFASAENKELALFNEEVCDAIEVLITKGLDEAQNRYNK
ncbi:MAG: aminoacyl-tRNA hydrolase [Actinobacteria bacterium]|nr:aminoacyl-tRNA hydrolase [Actinomycetota bacterium]